MERQRHTRPTATQYERRIYAAARPPAPVAVGPPPNVTAPAPSNTTITFNLGRPKFLRRAFWQPAIEPLRNFRVRLSLVIIAVVIALSQLIPLLQSSLIPHSYALGQGEALLETKSTYLGSKLKFDASSKAYNYNSGFSVTNQTTDDNSGGPQITAIMPQDPSKGLQVTDPVSNTTVTLTPQFQLLNGKQDANRIVYPLSDGTGWVVYTMQASGVKEDVVLRSANGDRMKLKYKLDLTSQGLAAHIQSDGSVGIYGSSLPISGNVSTGNDKDAALLQKARKNAKKDKLLFALPTPTVFQSKDNVSKTVHTHYELDGEYLTTVTTGLKAKGTAFPLDIDPAVTVISGSNDLFRDSNPDSNTDFNASSNTASRGLVTGGTLPAYSTTVNSTVNGTLNSARFLAGATAYDGYMYIAGGAGNNTTSNLSTVEFAKIDATGYIGTWATTTNLPAATNGLSRFTLLAYNGYLYAIGGSTTDTTCNTRSNLVYYNRIQTNGQLSGSWSTATPTLPSAVCGGGAAVASGVLYVAGGRTSTATTTGTNVVARAAILPNGNLASTFTTDATLPSTTFDNTVWSYNGYLYSSGGYVTASGTLTNAVYATPIKSDSSLNGWVSVNAGFKTTRSNMGAANILGYDGYVYVVGGCSAFNGTQSCTTVQNDTQIAQINADGTVGSFSTDAQATLSATGASVVAWGGYIYVIGGCSAMNSGTISCANGSTLNTASTSKVTSAGQIGPRNTATTTFTTGRYEHASAIVNGYIYVIGGCIGTGGGPSYDCQTSTTSTTSTTYYAPLSASGNITATWTLESHTGFNNANNGGAAMGIAVYNNYIYLIGGYSYTQGAYATVYYAQTTSTGAFTAAWATTSSIVNAAGTTTAKYGLSAFAYKGYVYAVGGCSNAAQATGCATTSYATTVQRAQINTNGTLGTWSTTGQTQLSAGRALAGLAVYNGYVYLAGGGTQANAGQDQYVLFNTITAAGITGTWTQATGNMTWTDNTTALKLRRTDAYAMNGYLYVTGGHDGEAGGQFGTYGTVQIGKINLATGNIDSNLQPSVTQITPRWDARTVFSNGYMYVTGGCSTGAPPASCSAASTLTEYVELYNAGNKGTSTWANQATPYSGNRVGASSVIYNGTIYVAGGCNAYTVGANFGPTTTFCTTPSSSVLSSVAYATLNADGSVGAWTTATNSLNVPRAFGCMAASGGYLYFVGGAQNSGTNGTASSTVQYSQLTGAVPGVWASSSTLLGGGAGQARKNISCGVFNNHIYVTGGIDGSNAYQATVYYSPDISNGGDITSWSTGTSFTTARANHVSVVAGGYLYVIGGDTGGTTTTGLQDVQYIQLLPAGGTTGSWAYATDLPQPITGQSAIAANGYIYVYGGRTGPTACLANTYVASVNSTGTTSSWSQAVNNFTRARFASTSVFNEGYYYVLGGDDCTNVIGTTASDVVQYGGQQSQAMTAQFSKYADLNGDGDPQKLVIYLTNAQLNSVDIEKWKMTYVSSREAANSWGAPTTINPLIDQNAYNVNAYDGSSVDQLVSRWFYLTFSIDMTTSFTFTDDTQPTIKQYGLHYSPPPSKRLLHGRDFRDQTQQGEDLKL